MNFFYKRIISGALAFVTLFLVYVPTSFASGASSLDTPTRGDFWSWLQAKDNAFKSIFDKDKCPKSPNTNGLHEFVKTTTTVDGKDGVYYVCRYCGDSADIVGKKVHQQQVDSLPASTITQNSLYMLYFCDFTYGKSALLSGDSLFYETFLSAILPNSVGARWSCYTLSQYGGASYGDICAKSALLYVPYDGAYRFDATFTHAYGHYFTSNSNRNYFQLYKSDGTKFFEGRNEGTIVNLSAGYYFCYLNTRYCFKGQGAEFSATFSGYPSLKLLGIDGIGLQPVSNVYATTTRPTAITGGNLGIVGDNGQITTINNNQQIINETNNTYYNPATGQTVPILNWTYDYGDRIYTLELEGSVTVDVRYGDENITITENTINEGDTIVNNYTIYYIIDGGSGETPGPSPTPGPEATPCPHAWAETSRTDPSCTAPGSASFSCSKCGETKTDKLPATGHTWQILRTVQTAYDEEGNLVQQGYTIYQCAVCSEQYKDDQGTGPPGGQEEDKETIWDKIASFFGSIVDGIAGIFEAILGKLLDALTALSELLMGKVKDVVEVVLSVLDEVPKLFDGFLNFLGVVFPFIPPEITLLLTFGIIAVVFIGIIKALRR